MINSLIFKRQRHLFHLVQPSQLPFLMAMTSFLFVSSVVFYWHNLNVMLCPYDWHHEWIFHLSCYCFLIFIVAWFLIIIYESALGHHNKIVRNGLRFGIVLFIVSEIMFFFSLFWAFFHYSLSPSIEFGYMWPPKGTITINIWGLPLTNTILLLTSGITITLAHHAIKTIDSFVQNGWKFINYLVSTIILGITFLICQWIEYTYGIRFRWTDNVYGSIFFIITGFHGFHVLLGTYGLLFCLFRALITSNLFSWNTTTFDKISRFIFKYNKKQLPLLLDVVKWQQYMHRYRFSSTNHIGFEAALWYWHFVDVVWIFVFVTIYWWGSSYSGDTSLH